MKRAQRPGKSRNSRPRTEFAQRLCRWHRRHGRHDLPWQARPTPYRVWVSEIMLQQTRVAAVIPYFIAFMKKFPGVQALAAADLDTVLQHWSGLGYYARARNLHRAAGLICERHEGALPGDIQALMRLPGIGRSTAGAILALSRGDAHPILDGNVKRVLCRYFGIAGWPGEKAVQEHLWSLSRSLVPAGNAAAYTQAIMDLGATICTRARPQCPACPVRDRCVARRRGRQAELPERRPRRSLPARRTMFALIENDRGAILLERRPEAGIWGGLWSLPECPDGRDPVHWVQKRFGWTVENPAHWPALRHTFTHFHLDIQPVHLRVRREPAGVREGNGTTWHIPGASFNGGLAAPVRKLIDDLHKIRQRGDP